MSNIVKKIKKNKKLSVEVLEERVKSLEKELEEKASQAGSDEYIDLVKEYNEISGKLKLVKKVLKINSEIEESKELLEDEEMVSVAKDEINRLGEEMDKFSVQLEELLKEPLPNDEAKAIVEIRPGVGGVEASLFAEELYRSYVRYCNDQGLKVEQISIDYEQEGGIKEAIFLVDTKGAFGKLRFESGVHRVQRVPVTESSGRIHTSTVSIVVMPRFENVNIDLNPNDLKIDVYRSSGPGGQSVNTTDSAVRITHTPTGIVVSCQSGKSQHKNKEQALSILKSRLYEIELEKKQSKEKSIRAASIRGGDRSAKIRTYNFPQVRVTDHRIKESWFNIDEIMEGEINEVVRTVSSRIRSELQEE